MDVITTTEEAVSTPRGMRLATLGFLMAGAGPLILIVAGLLFGLDTADLGFFVMPVIAAGLGAYLVRRRGTVPKVVAVFLAVLVLMTVFWTMFGLAVPDSFFDFVPGILVLPGVLLAIGSTVSAILAERGGRVAAGGERRAVVAILGVVGLLAIVSAVLTVAGRESVDDEAAAGADLVVDMKDFEFDPEAFDVPAGGTVLVKNSDPFLHTFTIEALDVDVDLGPGSEMLVTLPEEAGTYVVFCEPHTSDPDDPADDDMAGEITLG